MEFRCRQSSPIRELVVNALVANAFAFAAMCRKRDGYRNRLRKKGGPLSIPKIGHLNAILREITRVVQMGWKIDLISTQIVESGQYGCAIAVRGCSFSDRSM